MTTDQAKKELAQLGHNVEVMHVSIGNIYRCEALSGYEWMYKEPFITKSIEFLKGGK